MTIQKKAHSEQLRAMPYLLAVAVGLLALFWAVPSVHAEGSTSSDVPASASDALHDGSGGGGDGGGSGEIEIEGVLVIAPTQFAGKWFISPTPGVTVTVVLTDSPTIPTEIDHFDGLPAVGTWLQVKGAFQADGSLLGQPRAAGRIQSWSACRASEAGKQCGQLRHYPRSDPALDHASDGGHLFVQHRRR